jgi:hypothetical protein
MKKRTYYTLLERRPGEKAWAPQFGDFDKEVVEQERRDMRESGSFIKGTGFKIVATDGSMKHLNEVLAKENGVIVPKAPNSQVRKNLAKLERGRSETRGPDTELSLFRIGVVKTIYENEGADACLGLCKKFKKTKREMLMLLATFEK